MRALVLAGLLFASRAQADQKLQVIEVRQPESPAWGTNTATITIRNPDMRAHEARIAWQSTSLMVGRGWGLDSTETIAAGETRTFEREYIIPAFPGKVAHTFRIRDENGEAVLWERKSEYEFPFANSRSNPLRIPPRLQAAIKLARSEYPRLRMEQRGRIAIYYLEGDAYVAQRIEVIAAERERICRELAATVNPAFDGQIAIYLFPDADSKLAYTNHRGAGMANGRVLAEIFTEKERIDPYHEVAHIITGSIGDPPALFNEGFAAWSQEGHRWDGYAADRWAKAFAAHGMLWPLGKLFAFHEFGSDESRAPIAYPQGASVVNFLLERYGMEKFLAAFKTLKNTGDEAEVETNAAKFAGIFGASLAEVEKAWLAKLADPAIEPAPEGKVGEVLAKYR